MAPLKATLLASSMLALGACATAVDTGVVAGDGGPSVRALRQLVFVPSGFTLESGDILSGGPDCGDTARVAESFDGAAIVRIADWKGYALRRPPAAQAPAAIRLRAQLADAAIDGSFPRQVGREMAEQMDALAGADGADGVLVLAGHKRSFTLGKYAKTLGISLITLGVGGIAYAPSTMEAVAAAAIYDRGGRLVWWYRGTIPYPCRDANASVETIFDTLPTALSR